MFRFTTPTIPRLMQYKYTAKMLCKHIGVITLKLIVVVSSINNSFCTLLIVVKHCHDKNYAFYIVLHSQHRWCCLSLIVELRNPITGEKPTGHRWDMKPSLLVVLLLFSKPGTLHLHLL